MNIPVLNFAFEETLIKEICMIKEKINENFEESKNDLSQLEKPELHNNFRSKKVDELLEDLALNIVENQDVLYLLMFISAIENNEELTNLIKEKTDNFEGYITPKDSGEPLNMVDIFTQDPSILNRAFGHAVTL